MIPIKLTENHYINPAAIDQVLIRPKTDERPAALCIVCGRSVGTWGGSRALTHPNHQREGSVFNVKVPS